MNGKRKLGTLAAVVGLSFAAAAQQQEAPPAGIAPPARMEVGAQRRQVSLREALQLAGRQSPQVAAARAQAQVTQVGVEHAWTAWQPQILAIGTWDRTNATSVIPAGALGAGSPEIKLVGKDSQYATFSFSQPLFTPEGLFLPGIANAAAEAAQRGADEAREQVLLDVSRTYLALEGLDGLIAAAREAEKVALQRERDAKARIAAGTDVEIALLRAQAETAASRAVIAQRQGQKESLLPLLQALVGEPIEPRPGSISEFGAPAEESAGPWEQAFAVRSAIAAVEANSKSVRLQRFAWLPSINGLAKENYTSNGGFADKNWTWDLILNVTIPLYDRGQRYAQLHENEARLSQAQAELASTRARARANWIGARANLDAYEAVLRQRQSQEQLARRTQAQVEASYRAGVATSLDLSDADQRRFQAQSDVVEAQANFELRKVELMAAEGRLYETSSR